MDGDRDRVHRPFRARVPCRVYEPANRREAHATQTASLIGQGADLFAANCASCLGVMGEGVDAPLSTRDSSSPPPQTNRSPVSSPTGY